MVLSGVEWSLNRFKNVQRVNSTFLLSKVLLGDVESDLRSDKEVETS